MRQSQDPAEEVEGASGNRCLLVDLYGEGCVGKGRRQLKLSLVKKPTITERKSG